jgi:conjugative transfer region protein TrbK
MPGGPAFLIRFIAFMLGAIAILAGFVELAMVPMRPARPVSEQAPLTSELARCGNLPIKEADTDAGCKTPWSGMRSHFLAPTTAADREAKR